MPYRPPLLPDATPVADPTDPPVRRPDAPGRLPLPGEPVTPTPSGDRFPGG
ncbi:hypothetical protein [Micromonospora sp. WMMD714]|uniref:hypothetical protein n=1 Tax=Micromonospora sp. WMMD714 TaxID=3016097 RepID=UPI00249A15F2|nr:hypothetical protein [Micromonospora sp. WMMD714]WFE65850.1 hypothetical protein O7625_22350 [Micromonospora sp. WMMD714]